MNIIMPQLGETVAEGKIANWFKAVGDKVKAGENLFEIETDKVTMEVQATENGLLTEIRVAAGETVPVGTVVAVLGGADGKPAPDTRPWFVTRREWSFRDAVRSPTYWLLLASMIGCSGGKAQRRRTVGNQGGALRHAALRRAAHADRPIHQGQCGARS